jgi:hypothetical protein
MTTGPESERLAQAGAWAERAAALAQEYSELAEASGEQFVSLTQRAETNRRLIGKVRRGYRILAASIAADIVLTVVLGLGWNTLHTNEQRISLLTQRLDTAQTSTRRDTLCPLYGLFLASENPKSRAVYPQGPAAYDAAFAVIRQGWTALGCAAFAAGPAPSAAPTP